MRHELMIDQPADQNDKTPNSREVCARITRLEMAAPQAYSIPYPAGMRLALMRAETMPVHFYRYLYEIIGKPHHWVLRRQQSDEDLLQHLHNKHTRINLLYVDGCPAGFAEYSLDNMPNSVDILYFGLVPDYQGRGLARFFLSETLASAWSHDPRRLSIETNSLDSPRALQLYQKMGFTPVGWSEEMIPLWE